jgi:hypothetical protein
MPGYLLRCCQEKMEGYTDVKETISEFRFWAAFKRRYDVRGGCDR